MYTQHYGAPPQFLRGGEEIIALSVHGDDLRDALAGRDDGSAAPSNPHNIKFYRFTSEHLQDAFGNENIFLIARRPDRLTISQSSFPPSIRGAVPREGIADAYAIWNETDHLDRRVTSWQ
jgi:hypothetical protein